MAGPLEGVTVVELAGIGPAPFCGMVLSDHGADVIRVERPFGAGLPLPDPSRRGRRSIVLDLKVPEAVEVVLLLVERADALIEGYRPGVAERLGLGPEVCLARNPHLVYGRVTGWGQEGPLAGTAGHDIDYVALSGVLSCIGPADRPPVVPLNLLGDDGGGGMLLAFGVVAGLLRAARTGEGEVVDAAMVDGAALLAQPVFEWLGRGAWRDSRDANLLDGSAPFYRTYATADGEVAVGALEPAFYEQLLAGLGLDPETVPDRGDRSAWPRLGALLADRFSSRTRDEWMDVFAGSDACVAPVLSLAEAPLHPHNRARETFVEVDGVLQPGPAPRFALAGAAPPRPAPPPGSDTGEILRGLGLGQEAVDRLRRSRALG